MIKQFISKHSIISFLSITFAISWSIAFYILASTTKAATEFPATMVIGGIALGLVPSLTGIILSKYLHTPLLYRLKLKSSKSFYFISLLFIPLTALLGACITNLCITPWSFHFNIAPLIIGLIWPIFSSCGEELGWRGFLLPRLLKKYSSSTSSAIIGVIWGIWHIPMFWLTYRSLPNTGIVMTFLQAFNLSLLTYLMVALQVLSKGNIKLAILFHYTITAMGILPQAYISWSNSTEFTDLNSVVVLIVIRLIAILIFYSKYNKQINLDTNIDSFSL